jgi:hypothetical protein
MSNRRLATTKQDTAAHAPLRHRHAPSSGLADRLARPRTREEAEEHYIAARNAWTAAMRAAGGGRASDLAALAIAQDDYEAALAERERWPSSPPVAVPTETDRPSGIDVVVGQELSWRRVYEHKRERAKATGIRGFFSRLTRR